MASVCTNDPSVARELVTGIAAHHGRVLLLNREDALIMWKDPIRTEVKERG